MNQQSRGGIIVSHLLTLCLLCFGLTANQVQLAKSEDHAVHRTESGKIDLIDCAEEQWQIVRKIVDLSYPLHNGTLNWPKNSGFLYKLDVDSDKKGPNGETYHIRSDSFTTSVHVGTHLDAPRHFNKNGWTVEQIALDRLVDVPITVIDLSNKVKLNRSYNFVKEDFLDQKTKTPLVQAKSVVLVYTGISLQYDKGEKAYFGTDSKNISEMKIPGFSKEAAQYLVERQVYGVGLDAPSADSSDKHDKNDQYNPESHVVFNSNNIYILENVSNKLKELINVPTARIIATPLPIVSASGSPIRLVAVVGGKDKCLCPKKNAASAHLLNASGLFYALTIIIALSYTLTTSGLLTRPLH